MQNAQTCWSGMHFTIQSPQRIVSKYFIYVHTLRVFLISLWLVCPTDMIFMSSLRNISAPYNEHIFPCIISFVLQYKTVLNTHAKIDKSDFCYLKDSKSSIRSLTQNMCSLNCLRTKHLLSEGVSWKIKGKWPVQECDSYTFLNCLQLEVICKYPLFCIVIFFLFKNMCNCHN